ncbi:unnamed protein product, partial [Prorocentrum cordatum]
MPAKVEVRELVSDLHGQPLKGLAHEHGVHVEGLSAAARFPTDMPQTRRNDMVNIDVADHLCEHVTQQSVSQFNAEVCGSEVSVDFTSSGGAATAAPRYRPRGPGVSVDPSAVEFATQ